jgi:hypothetical protein
VAVDPVGTWNCVIYGHPEFGDERVLLNFGANGGSQLARQDGDEITPWTALSFWLSDDDGVMTFTDPRSGRRFEADLTRGTLGGSWRTYTLLGGWWCSAADFGAAPAIERAKSTHYMPPLLPSLTATPRYPVQAIREAKQGRAVSCFFVDANGYIVQPELIELSDEVFRQPILNALARSRYQTWADESVLRPGCRSFIFRLDAINAAAE